VLSIIAEADDPWGLLQAARVIRLEDLKRRKAITGEEVWHGSEHDGSTELPGANRSWFAKWRWGAFTTTA